MLPEQIKSVKEYKQYSLKEKGSEFIAIVYSADNDTIAQNYLSEVRKNITMQLIIVMLIKLKPVSKNILMMANQTVQPESES